MACQRGQKEGAYFYTPHIDPSASASPSLSFLDKARLMVYFFYVCAQVTFSFPFDVELTCTQKVSLLPIISPLSVVVEIPLKFVKEGLLAEGACTWTLFLFFALSCLAFINTTGLKLPNVTILILDLKRSRCKMAKLYILLCG